MFPQAVRAGLAILFAGVLWTSPAPASAQSWQNLAVGSAGFEAGVPVAPLATLRITASGSVTYVMAPAGCLSVGPRGCALDDARRGAPQPLAPAAALVAVFLDGKNVPVSPVFFVGDAALAMVPATAVKLAFAVNVDPARRGSGAFNATVALERSAQAHTRTDLTPGARPVPNVRRSLADPDVSGRFFVQHLLRRFGFGAPPETISAIVRGGWPVWLAQQLMPASVDDSAALGALEAKPTTTDKDGNIVDPDAFERRLVQRQFATARQVQEKLVLHWLDHFSIGNAKVQDAALMSHYEETLRADALGNFKRLIVDVSKEPAMLYWLDNNANNGSDLANHPPNENFARELMQLFVMGTTKLGPDATPQLDAGRRPIPAYTQADVRAVAAALTGFLVNIDYTGGRDPNARFAVNFVADIHAPGPKTILGTQIADPATPAVLDAVADVLVRAPSTAPFQAKELLQRFVTETPSPRYIASVAAVWAANVDAPDQLARVVDAVVRDPEFAASYRGMGKEPAEFTMQALREVPGVLKAANAAGMPIGAGEDIVGDFGFNGAALQSLYNPPSVFSFYRPGSKDAIVAQETYLNRVLTIADIVASDASDPAANTALDGAALLRRIGSSDPARVAAYVLDALVDGGTPALRASLATYLGSATVDDTRLRGAVWIVMTSALYEVN